MGMTAEDYLAQLQALLPQGPAWPRDAGATLTKLLRAMADELARVDGRAGRIIEEADPRTTAELLADWERVAGLPDSCVTAEPSTVQRRAALHARLTTLGGQSAAYFVALAARLGYTVTITEHRTFTVKSAVNDPLYDTEWRFAFVVHAPLNTTRRFNVRSAVSDPLASWGNAALECMVNRLKPAHTIALFAYT